MNQIHIADPQGRQQIYDLQEALRLWREGAIARNSHYWREGMIEWRPAVEYFDSLPKPPPSDSPPPIPSSPVPRGFVKDPIGLTQFLVIMLWAYFVANGVSALATVVSLATGRAKNAETDELSTMDVVDLVIALPQMLIVLVTGVVFLMWIHRANRNARGLGAQGMTFSPGWSVGWFFVPIANLWKPYHAMKEIWKASANPTAWQAQNPPSFLSAWWALWIASNVLANMSFRMSMRADTAQEMIASEIVTLISCLLDIPLCLVALRLVREVIRLQTHWAGQDIQTPQASCEMCLRPTPSSDLIRLNDLWVCAACKPILLQKIRESAPDP